MRRGLLITRGAIIETGAVVPWSLTVSNETTVLAVAALMQAFGCYAELPEGAADLRLIPLDFRPEPTAQQMVSFYQREHGATPRAVLRYHDGRTPVHITDVGEWLSKWAAP
jgi:hypothetical protein